MCIKSDIFIRLHIIFATLRKKWQLDYFPLSLSSIEDSWPAKLYSELFLAFFFPSINLVTVHACVSSVSFRKSMKKHRDMGHDFSRLLPATALLEDLSCPFCLYRTKNKNYMIDHIVLHRGQSATPTGFCSQYPSRPTSPHTFFLSCRFRGARRPHWAVSPASVTLPPGHRPPLPQMHFYERQCRKPTCAHGEARWHQALQVSALLLRLHPAEWLGSPPEWQASGEHHC